jgi:hypothetical protein
MRIKKPLFSEKNPFSFSSLFLFLTAICGARSVVYLGGGFKEGKVFFCWLCVYVSVSLFST